MIHAITTIISITTSYPVQNHITTTTQLYIIILHRPYVYVYVLASAGNQFGTPVFFLADAPARYNAWDEFVFIVFIDFWLREVMNFVPLFLLRGYAGDV